MLKTVVYPGSFDPITNGHISIIERAIKLFDKVIIAVSYNENKKHTFSLEERISFIKGALPTDWSVEVHGFEGLMVEFCKQVETNVICRGLRVISDVDYEFQLAFANRKMNQDIETIFLMPDNQYTYLSSSLIRGMASHKGNIKGLVPENVRLVLEKR
jgi:pantetheine-phosphate adenylyltransferase